ncbi:MAG: Unknown protein [uncultured Sulfurovum sp.]|uniref:Outer membrane protein beta-barrel domain-containing protein n=1 Tax=uncultured Sulfurovum sp. TaxID=269237 RepID=A0A6S6SWB4_9BACT|nr:MAG: Unknown protein [uncultured Sulfurovum sp.]
MKKITLLLLITLLSTQTIVAKEKFTFIGVSVSQKNIEFKTLDDEKEAAVGLLFGMQNKGYRVTLKAEKDFTSLNEYSIQSDLLLNTVKVEKMLFKPYVGVSLGGIKHDKNDQYNSMYGLHFGALINIDDNFDVDLSYNMKDKRDSSTLRKYRGLTLALHYYF